MGGNGEEFRDDPSLLGTGYSSKGEAGLAVYRSRHGDSGTGFCVRKMKILDDEISFRIMSKIF